MSALVIGVDPGATTGLFLLTIDGLGLTGVARELSDMELRHVAAIVAARVADERMSLTKPLLAVEAFVVSNRAGRSATPKAGQLARDIIGALGAIDGVDFVSHPAHRVKRWATDQRLAAAGLLDVTVGLGHARDASRHALFAAVEHKLMRDPLSTKDEVFSS